MLAQNDRRTKPRHTDDIADDTLVYLVESTKLQQGEIISGHLYVDLRLASDDPGHLLRFTRDRVTHDDLATL